MTPTITDHYQAQQEITQLWEQICQTLSNAEIDMQDITSDLLAPVDQLHTGGRKASIALLEKTSLPSGSSIVEIGAGLGGTARVLADKLNAHVTAVDITPSFSYACQQINQLMQYSSINTICADACLLDQIESNSQDAVWSQHTIMNIPDKSAVLDTIQRILKPGGQLLLHEIVAGTNKEPITLPVPWASEPEHSHLPDNAGLRSLFENHGFTINSWEDISDNTLNWRKKHSERESGERKTGHTQQKSPLNPTLIFGTRFQQMGKNVQQNLANGRISIIQAILEKQ